MKKKDPEKSPVNLSQSEFSSSYRFNNSSKKNIKNMVNGYIMMKD